ncbi:MAG: 4-vinyl reductase, partial [Thaumarchaeota archaeon]|nr:4-vinyl reductase [Nitrososphaerota archaeon]
QTYSCEFRITENLRRADEVLFFISGKKAYLRFFKLKLYQKESVSQLTLTAKSPKESVKEIITRNPNSGLLEDGFLKLRVMIIDEEFYKGIRNKLYATFKSGAPVILYDMGRGNGELRGLKMEEMKMSKVEVIRSFMNLGKNKGYGNFRTPFLKMILSGIRGEPVVRIEDCFFATSAGKTGKPECFLMAGIIAGASQILLQKKFSCVEEKCLCKGDEYCEFKLKEKY